MLVVVTFVKTQCSGGRRTRVHRWPLPFAQPVRVLLPRGCRGPPARVLLFLQPPPAHQRQREKTGPVHLGGTRCGRSAEHDAIEPDHDEAKRVARAGSLPSQGGRGSRLVHEGRD